MATPQLIQSPDKFVVGSRDRIAGTVKDIRDGAVVLNDFSGATLIIRAQINKRTAKSFAATFESDQTTFKGKYFYDPTPTDFDVAGSLELQAHVSLGGKTYKSTIVRREVEKSI